MRRRNATARSAWVRILVNRPALDLPLRGRIPKESRGSSHKDLEEEWKIEGAYSPGEPFEPRPVACTKPPRRREGRAEGRGVDDQPAAAMQ